MKFIKLLLGNKDYTPQSKRILTKFSNQYINDIKIVRKELSAGLKTLLNIITFNDFEKKAKELGYDKLYHLSMIIDTDNGRFLIEKNDIIHLKEKPKIDGEYMNIHLKKRITVDTLLSRTQTLMGNDFFSYNATSNNCSHFIYSILKANGLDTVYITNFIKEDLNGLFEANRRKFINTTVEVGGRLHEYINNNVGGN